MPCDAMQLTESSDQANDETKADILLRFVHAAWSKPSYSLCFGTEADSRSAAILAFCGFFASSSRRWIMYFTHVTKLHVASNNVRDNCF
jgi:hypothetical protein